MSNNIIHVNFRTEKNREQFLQELLLALRRGGAGLDAMGFVGAEEWTEAAADNNPLTMITNDPAAIEAMANSILHRDCDELAAYAQNIRDITTQYADLLMHHIKTCPKRFPNGEV